MPTIVFIELDPTPTEAAPAEGLGVLPLLGFAFADLEALGAAGYGELALLQANAAESIGAPTFGAGDGSLPLLAGYSFAPLVEEAAAGDGELLLYGTGFEAADYGNGQLRLYGAGLVGEPYFVDDEPYAELYEWLAIEDTSLGQETLSVEARLSGITSMTTNATLLTTIVDLLRISERLRIVLEALVSDTLVVDALLQGQPVAMTALTDTLLLTGDATSTVAAMAVLSDLLALQQALVSVQEGELSDSAELAGELDGLVRALEALVSTAMFSETLLGLAVLTVLVPESLNASVELEGVALYQAIIDEGLAFSVGFALDGVPYVGLAMNATTRAMSEYDAFNYNSLAWYNGRLYGAGPAGLYRLEGATDAGNPIAAYFRTAMQRLADGKECRVSSAYLGFRSNGELQLKVVFIDAAGEKVGYVYDLAQAPTGAPQPGRFKVGRGIKSVYMAFELGNVAGADFAIDVLEIRPLVLDRRLP